MVVAGTIARLFGIQQRTPVKDDKSMRAEAAARTAKLTVFEQLRTAREMLRRESQTLAD